MNKNYFDFIGTKKECIELAKSRQNSVIDPSFVFKLSPRKYGLAFGAKLFLINGYEIVAKITD
jgi:hypothetical protein